MPYPLIWPPPPAMPDIREALLDVKEATKALQRGEDAWNKTQLEDALNSAEFFIKKARLHLTTEGATS